MELALVADDAVRDQLAVAGKPGGRAVAGRVEGVEPGRRRGTAQDGGVAIEVEDGVLANEERRRPGEMEVARRAGPVEERDRAVLRGVGIEQIVEVVEDREVVVEETELADGGLGAEVDAEDGEARRARAKRDDLVAQRGGEALAGAQAPRARVRTEDREPQVGTRGVAGGATEPRGGEEVARAEQVDLELHGWAADLREEVAGLGEGALWVRIEVAQQVSEIVDERGLLGVVGEAGDGRGAPLQGERADHLRARGRVTRGDGEAHGERELGLHG